MDIRFGAETEINDQCNPGKDDELSPFFEHSFRKTDFSFLKILAAQGFPGFRFEQGFFKTSQNVELLFLRPDAI